jgi:hypothetical protein
MPRRNINAGTPRPDTEHLAAELAWLASELRPAARYLARSVQVRYLPAMTGEQPTPRLATESR